ncbi:MAG: deaminase, partial [Bacilli bacterium]
IQKIVYGAKEPKFGVLNSLGNVYLDYNFNHKVDIVGPIMEEKVSELMKKFFKELRDQKKQTLEN